MENLTEPHQVEKDEPLVFECTNCGDELCPMGRDVTCGCGTQYNASGQQLRANWSWDDDGRDYDC